MYDASRARELLGRVAHALAEHEKKGYLLDQIAWPREVEDRFFAASAGALPEVAYSIDRAGLEAHVAELTAVALDVDRHGGGEEPIAAWLRRVVASQIDADRLALAAGTAAFSDLSRELYGSARTPFFEGKATNLDLADHLLERLSVHGWDEASDPEETPLDAQAFGELLAGHVDRMRPRMDVEIVIDPACTAK